MKPVTVSRIQPLVKSITDGRLINRLNRRLMAYYWHGDKPCKTLQTTQGEAHPAAAKTNCLAVIDQCSEPHGAIVQRCTHDPTESTYGVNGLHYAIPCPRTKPV